MFDSSVLDFLIAHGYWVAVPAMIIEGPIATMLMAFFASFGLFDIRAVFFLSLLADLVSDAAYYFLGYWRGLHVIAWAVKHLRIRPEIFESIGRYYQAHGGKTVFLAKILTGIVPPVFITAGIYRMSIKKMILFALPGGVIWSGGLVFFGHRFGSVVGGDFGGVGALLGQTGLVLLSLLLLLAFYRFVFADWLKRRLDLSGRRKEEM